MNKLFLLCLSLALVFSAAAQETPQPNLLEGANADNVLDTVPNVDADVLIEETREERKKRKKMEMAGLNLANRSKDHLLLQLGFDGWGNMPDSINTRGLSRSFNAYLMFDFPFKTSPKLSVGIGAGIGTSNMYFKDTYIDIAGRQGNRLSFNDVSDTTRFKKYKLATAFLEAPVELRYTARPQTPKKSFKAAAGVKVGTMLSAVVKGKNLLNGSGQSINNFTSKEKSKRFFNSTRISLTGRMGYGNLSIFGTYQINALIKEGFGPDVRPYSIGLTLSGL